MFPNEKARLMRMMDSHGIPAENESGAKMDFTQRVTWLIEHANHQRVQRTGGESGQQNLVTVGNPPPAKVTAKSPRR